MSNKFALSDVKEYPPDMSAKPSKSTEVLPSETPAPANLAEIDENIVLPDHAADLAGL